MVVGDRIGGAFGDLAAAAGAATPLALTGGAVQHTQGSPRHGGCDPGLEDATPLALEEDLRAVIDVGAGTCLLNRAPLAWACPADDLSSAVGRCGWGGEVVQTGVADRRRASARGGRARRRPRDFCHPTKRADSRYACGSPRLARLSMVFPDCPRLSPPPVGEDDTIHSAVDRARMRRLILRAIRQARR